MSAPDAAQLDRHECRTCGYVYEPSEGDKKGNVAPGTPFTELPVTWRCPNCRAPVSKFGNIGPREGNTVGFTENAGYGLGLNKVSGQTRSLFIFGGLLLGILFLMSIYLWGN
jgi:rubredoxin